jgi:hypothetical protein
MPLEKIEFPSENQLGPVPGYISSGEHKAVIVLQEVKHEIASFSFACIFIFILFLSNNFIII